MQKQVSIIRVVIEAIIAVANIVTMRIWMTARLLRMANKESFQLAVRMRELISETIGSMNSSKKRKVQLYIQGVSIAFVDFLKAYCSAHVYVIPQASMWYSTLRKVTAHRLKKEWSRDVSEAEIVAYIKANKLHNKQAYFHLALAAFFRELNAEKTARFEREQAKQNDSISAIRKITEVNIRDAGKYLRGDDMAELVSIINKKGE